MAKYKPDDGKIALAKWMYENPQAYRDLPNKQYELWDRAAKESRGMGYDYDYGAVSPDNRDSRGHSGDAGKLPNHPTFSTQSSYSGLVTDPRTKLPMLGGTWELNKNNEGSTFTPSRRQVAEGVLHKLQWLMDNGYNDGDTYIDPRTKQPLVQHSTGKF